jgi:DNA polymerase (family 10)
LNRKFKGFRILAGSEVEIKSDGSLDYPDKVLKELDIVIGAIHSGFKQSREQLTSRIISAMENKYVNVIALTSRIISAMENKYVNVIAHPSGRLLGHREPYSLNMEKVLKKAKQTGTFMEINSFPERMDLTDINCRRAGEVGVKVAISTDSHKLEHLDYMELGVSVARRGWLGKKDVLNTMSLERLLKALK